MLEARAGPDEGAVTWARQALWWNPVLGGGQGLLWEGSKGVHPLWVPRPLNWLQVSLYYGAGSTGPGVQSEP